VTFYYYLFINALFILNMNSSLNMSNLNFEIILTKMLLLFGSLHKPHDSWYMFKRHEQKLIIFAFYWRFHDLLPIGLGFQCDFTRPMTLGTCLRGWPKLVVFNILWPFSWAIAPSFGVLGRFIRSKICWYMFEGHVQMLFSRFIIVFVELFPTFLEF
jgi:hypothetical protein